MKKILSMALVFAMVLSLFSSVAIAEVKSAQEKFDALKAKGIFQGYPDGTAGLDKNMSRQEFAVVLKRVFKLEKGAASYKDVSADRWSFDDISAVTAAGLMQGYPGGKFEPTKDVTVQEMLKTLVVGLKLTPESNATVSGDVSAWAKGFVAAALKAGLIVEQSNYKSAAKRDLLVEATYSTEQKLNPVVAITVTKAEVIDAKTVHFTFSDGEKVPVTIESGLVPNVETEVMATYKGVEYKQKVTYVVSQVEIAKAEVVGAKKLAVTLNAAVDTSKALLVIRSGSIVVPTTVEWNADKNVATLTATSNLPAGTHNVILTGLTNIAEGKGTAAFTVAAEKLEKIVFNENAYRTTGNQIEVSYVLQNQYGEDITSGMTTSDYEFYAAGVTTINSTVKGKLTYDVADTVTESQVSIIDRVTAKTAQAKVKINAAKKVAEIKLSAPELAKDQKRLTPGTYVLPYVAKDQYGNEVKLVQSDLAAFSIISSNSSVASATELSVDAENKLKLTLKQVSGSQDVRLNFINLNTFKTESLLLTVYGPGTPDVPTLVAPTTKFSLGKSFNVQLKMTDNYGEELKADDIVALGNKLTVFSNNNDRFIVDGVVKEGDKAFVKLDPKSIGNAELTVVNNANSKNAKITLTVVEAAFAQTIALSSDYNYAEKGAPITVKATVKDQYGEAIESGNAGQIILSTDNEHFGSVASSYSITQLKDGVTFTAAEFDKVTKVTAKLYKSATINADNLADTKDISLVSIKADATLTYQLKNVGTLYGKQTNANSDHAVKLELFGKDAVNNNVSLVNNKISTISSTNLDSVGFDTATNKIYGKNKGASTVMVYSSNSTTPLASINVTVDDVDPYAKSVVFGQESITVTKGEANSSKVVDEIKVVDQYGVELNYNGGTFTSTKSDIVSVDATTGLITAKETGEVLIGYISKNGVTGTIKVIVQ